MKKIAFQASLPARTFNDKADFQQRVLGPMIAAMREQFRKQDVRGYIRISIMLDDVPEEVEEAIETISEAGFQPEVH